MHQAFSQIEHRPWPLPAAAWQWRQSWCDLLFAHWAVPAATLQRFVPKTLRVQEFEGSSWVGVVPFRMSGVMRRFVPDLPWVSAFPELNVRIYVEHERDGKPGVWFLSLDATNTLVVWAARKYFHLPYFRARMSLAKNGDFIEYRSSRENAEFAARYRSASQVYATGSDTLEHFLTERYCLYAAAPDGTLWRNDVHHLRWPLQRAEAAITTNTLFASHGLDVSGPPQQLHFAKRLDVVVWPAEQVD